MARIITTEWLIDHAQLPQKKLFWKHTDGFTVKTKDILFGLPDVSVTMCKDCSHWIRSQKDPHKGRCQLLCGYDETLEEYTAVTRYETDCCSRGDNKFDY